MKHYKDNNGEVYAFEQDGSQDHLITQDMAELTQLEIDTLHGRTPEQLAQKAIEEANAEARAYLSSTDWYVIRQQETGVAIPQDILDARNLARSKVV